MQCYNFLCQVMDNTEMLSVLIRGSMNEASTADKITQLTVRVRAALN